MKHPILALFLGFVSLFGLSSCLQISETISLKKDGSGTITKELVYGAQAVQMMEGLGAGGQNPLADLYDEAKYKKEAAGQGEGVAFSKMEKIARDGGKGVRVTFTFADINKVKFAPGSAMNDLNKNQPGGAPKADVETKPITFTYADGKLAINMPDIPEDAAGGAPGGDVPAGDPAMEAMMAQMLADMKVSATLVVEPGIAKSNATHVEGNKITIMEMNFGEIVKNPEGMKALQKVGQAGPEKMKEALKGIKGVKLETEKTVNVTVK